MPNVIKPKVGYADFYFVKVVVSSASFAANTAPDIIVNVAGVNNFSICNETTGSVVEVSYNGNTVQDELDASLPTRFLLYNNRRVDTVWLRLKSGSASTIAIRAW